MKSDVSAVGGSQIGWVSASWPFAKLVVSKQQLTLSCLGTYVFEPQQIAALEPHGFIPFFARGVRIVHSRADYPAKKIFWCLGRLPIAVAAVASCTLCCAAELTLKAVTSPLTLEPARWSTSAEITSSPEGIHIKVNCQQPASVVRAAPTRARDSKDLESDAVSVVIDFDGTGQRAYVLSVSRSNVQRDATLGRDGIVNTDWDGRWTSSISERSGLPENEGQSGWEAKLDIPWTMVSMRSAYRGKRAIGVQVQRVVKFDNETYSEPAVGAQDPTLLSKLTRIELDAFEASSFDISVFSSFGANFNTGDIRERAGADLFYRGRGAQLNVSISPDFGQVEADDLVVNFDAIEVFQSDKRPFFTENQSHFEPVLGTADSLIFTRRMGGLSDRAQNGIAFIDGAAKGTISFSNLTLGGIVVQEESAEGRDFTVLRGLQAFSAGSVGFFASSVDRPFLQRQADTQAIDARVSLNPKMQLSSILIRSQIDDSDRQIDGTGGSLIWSYQPTPLRSMGARVTHYDRALDLNDVGFLRRRSLNQAQWNTSFGRQTAAESNFKSDRFGLTAQVNFNDSGQHLQDLFRISRTMTMVSGDSHSIFLTVNPSGVDDLIARGNGILKLPTRRSLLYQFSRPTAAGSRINVSGNVLQEGLSGYAWQASIGGLTQFSDTWSIDSNLTYRKSDDWLIWANSLNFSQFSRSQITLNGSMNFIPSERHEFRVKAQAIAISANQGVRYILEPTGNLQRSSNVVSPFRVQNFGIQARYVFRYAAGQEFYVAYSRGGFLREAEDESVGDTLIDALSLKQDDQLFAKLRWSF